MNKEQYANAIKGKLEFSELLSICNSMYGNLHKLNFDFYFPDDFIDVCIKRLNNEIDDEYFSTWLVLACNLLCRNSQHYELSDYLDGMSFTDNFTAPICQEIIAFIRDYDLKFTHPDFINFHKKKKMKVIYLRFEMVDHSADNIIYKCYIVDHAKKTFDLRFVDEGMLDFDLSKNFCHIRDKEHHQDIIKQEDDKTIEIIDCSKPEKQFCEAEEQLQELFFNNNYTRDKNIKL